MQKYCANVKLSKYGFDILRPKYIKVQMYIRYLRIVKSCVASSHNENLLTTDCYLFQKIRK